MEKTKETSKKELLLIDPPSGWKYGFPKAITQEQYKSITDLRQWCLDNGYPSSEAILYGNHFHIQITGDLSFMEKEQKRLKDLNDIVETFPKLKPNKKQFVEFNGELARKYLNKFNDNSKKHFCLETFNMLSKSDLQYLKACLVEIISEK